MPLPEKKEEDYFVAFTNSWKKIWEYKTLWFWGMALSFFGERFSSSEAKDQPRVDSFWKNLTEEQVKEKINQGLIWLEKNWQLFFLAVIFFLAVGFLIFSLTIWIKGGLIAFLAKKNKKMHWKKNWHQVWQEGKKVFWRLFKLDLLFFLMFFGLLLLWLLFLGGIGVWLLFLESVFWQNVLQVLFFIISLIMLALGVFLFFNKFLADFLVVILEKEIKTAFWESGFILKRKKREFLKLLGMLVLGFFLSQLAFGTVSFLWQAFFSGVYLVFHFPFQFLSGGMNSFKETNLTWTPIYFWLNIFISGLYILFNLEYRIWWLEKNKIIKIQKENKEDFIGEKEAKLIELEAVKVAKRSEIESLKN